MALVAEGFSRLGVPVFMADVKGDVAGLALPGSPNENIRRRAAMAQAGGAHSRKPDRPADPAGRAGRYPRRIASLVAGHGPHCTSGAGRFQPWPCRTRPSPGVDWK